MYNLKVLISNNFLFAEFLRSPSPTFNHRVGNHAISLICERLMQINITFEETRNSWPNKRLPSAPSVTILAPETPRKNFFPSDSQTTEDIPF